jgi:signal transduction histidine kinase
VWRGSCDWEALDDKWGAVGIVDDITEEVELQSRNEEQKRELEIYSSLMRHDLKNDLGVIMGNVEVVHMMIGDSNPALTEICSESDAVVQRMMNLLNAFGTASSTTETNPAKLVRSVASLALQTQGQLQFNIEVDEDVEDLEISSSRMLPMVFDNLFRNIVVHAGDDSIVTVDVTRSDPFVEFIITDNGPGVSEKVRKQLFQKGVSTKGGGMGLYLSREIVRAMSGEMKLIDSSVGEGAKFLIRLPIKHLDSKVSGEACS